MVIASGVLTCAILIPDRAPWQRAGIFHHGQAAGVVAVQLHLAQCLSRLEQPLEEPLLGIARADHPCGDAIDRRIKEIEADVDTFHLTTGDTLLKDRGGRIVQGDDVVAIPTHTTAHVQQQLRHIE